MSTRIQWADETWNPMTGCTPVSEACEHCYAERMAGRNLPVTRCPDCNTGGDIGPCGPSPENYAFCDRCRDTGYVNFTPTFHPDRLDKPLHWRKPRRVFVCSMSDLFHEAFTDEQIAMVCAEMYRAPQHTYLILTKRPERMRTFFTSDSLPMPHNWWLGVTVENQQRADERIPVLLDTPAAVRFVSVEPMLGPVRLGPLEGEMGFTSLHSNFPGMVPGIDWVIVGGETGPGARPMQPEWALDVYRQCKAAGVPFFFKQWGAASHITWHPVSEHAEMEQTSEFPRQEEDHL